MSEPYFESPGVTLYHGDCLDVLREMPDASVDAVVTDPPYNLRFMAKPWDAYEGREDAGFAYWLGGLIDGEGHFAIKAHTRGTHAPYFQLKMRADERGTLDRIRRSLGVGVVSLEAHEPNPMAKYIIQDKAGCQRLVDLLDKYPLRAKKALDYWTWREAVCEWTSRPRGNRWLGGADNTRMAQLRERLMSTRAYTDIPWSGDEFQDWCRLWAAECLRVLKPGGHLLAFGGTRTFHRLACAVEDAGFEIRDSIAWLYGSGFPKSLDVSKAIDTAAGAERAKSGVRGNTQCSYLDRGDACPGHGDAGQSMRGATVHRPPTAPATDAAREWQGWGTAMKPAFEPVVMARKPLGGSVSVRARVEHELRLAGVEGEIQWTTRPANDAASPSHTATSGTTEPRPTAATSARTANASETPRTAKKTARHTAKPAGDGEPRTSSTLEPRSAATTASSASRFSTHTDPTVSAAVNPNEYSSPSTTSKAAEPSTASPSMERSTPNCGASDSPPVTESFAGTATGLRGSSATVRIDKLSDGTFIWPDELPERVSGGSTVAANVQAHGTGALNIDATRIGDADGRGGGSKASSGYSGIGGYEGRFVPATAGRWPANVVLDESQAEQLDAMTGQLTSGYMKPETDRSTRQGDAYGVFSARTLTETYGDTGGASRYFYTAKADAGERVRVDGIAHPTVKPLSLMRWLVRLVTPPGGTVLEPFAGSGTTVEACILEGFQCIAIEREADYLPLIVQRVNRQRDPIAYTRAAGEDLGLFDIEEPA